MKYAVLKNYEVAAYCATQDDAESWIDRHTRAPKLRAVPERGMEVADEPVTRYAIWAGGGSGPEIWTGYRVPIEEAV